MGKSSFLQEFKAFAMKGNVVDMYYILRFTIWLCTKLSTLN